MPFALITAAEAGDFRNAINALAPSIPWCPQPRRGKNQLLLHFVGEWADEVHAGRHQHVDEKNPELGLALGHRLRDRRRARCTLVFAFISSAMPRRSNTFETCAPAALAGRKAMDCALRSVCFRASGVLMSGLGAPARTAMPKPTRRCRWSGRARNAPSRRHPETRRGNDGQVERRAGGGELDQVRGRVEVDGDLVSVARSNCGTSSFSGPVIEPPARSLEFGGV